MAIKDFGHEIFTATDIDLYLMNQAIIVCTSVTRPSNPSTGMRVWETDTLSEKLWDGSTWRFLKGLNFFVRKTSDESVSSTTTLHNDTQLFIPNFPINSTYIFDAMILYNSPTAADMKIKFNGGGTSWVNWAPGTTETNVDQSSINIQYRSLGDDAVAGYGSSVAIFPRGTVTVGGSSFGTMNFQWAQNTSNATNTTVMASSWIYFRKVA